MKNLHISNKFRIFANVIREESYLLKPSEDEGKVK
nr:MAG TPA: hypothetical protein [Caudoviricetes sp.]